MYVYVGHGTSRGSSLGRYDITGRGRDPNSNGEQRWPNRRNYSRMLSARDGGGSLGFKFGRVTERAGARAAFPNYGDLESHVFLSEIRCYPSLVSDTRAEQAERGI